ncbi:MAG TPA: isopentenyl-diphosphate Delta-isomerase [Candidatus Paceibacterota bacterium]|nr:isopentenyl-diphosphate Delta-isomerase [Candidatus Paceibacterota bacterium]
MEKVILTNEKGERLGLEEKLWAHQLGKLHLAFSIFIFNREGKLMLQKRANEKYHGGGLWTNTCCGHPRETEMSEAAAKRRLREEMGFHCEMKNVGHIIYYTPVGDLFEHEYLHIFIGEYNEEPRINPEEASDWKWTDFDFLVEDIAKNPNLYTPWLKIVLDTFDHALLRSKISVPANSGFLK